MEAIYPWIFIPLMLYVIYSWVSGKVKEAFTVKPTLEPTDRASIKEGVAEAVKGIGALIGAVLLFVWWCFVVSLFVRLVLFFIGV